MSKLVIALAAAAFAATGAQAATTYTNEAAFLAAAGGGLAFQSFETPTTVGGISVVFPDVTFSCSASQYCPGFFGVRQINATDGRQTVYFATPSSATFTFASAITQFGIDVIDLGTAGNTSLTVNYVNGSSTPYVNFSGGGVAFVGIIDTIPFLSVTFSATANNDGIDFDRLQYRTAAVTPGVPEPATWVLMLGGFGLVGAAYRRRDAHRVAA